MFWVSQNVPHINANN